MAQTTIGTSNGLNSGLECAMISLPIGDMLSGTKGGGLRIASQRCGLRRNPINLVHLCLYQRTLTYSIRGSITVWMTSSLTGLDSTKHVNQHFQTN